mgnify:CR=1 FL=1
MKMWFVMLAVVAMSGMTVFAADEAKHEDAKSTEAVAETPDAKPEVKPEIRKDAKERLKEFINACMKERAGASKPEIPASVK